IGAGRVQAILKSLDVILPVFPLVNVREAELPVLVRLINALQESLSLFVLRKMEEELKYPGAVTVEVFLQVHDGAIALLPKSFCILQLSRKPLTAENLRMHANDQYFFIIGTIENRSEEHTSELQSLR